MLWSDGISKISNAHFLVIMDLLILHDLALTEGLYGNHKLFLNSNDP